MEIGTDWAQTDCWRFSSDCAPFSCGLFTPHCLHPPSVADDNTTTLSAFHSCPFLPLQPRPGRSFHSSTCVATQKVRLRPKFCRNLVPLLLGFHRLEEMRRRRGRSLCVIHGRGVRAVWKHTSRERKLIYYHQKSAADVSSQIQSLLPIIDTHANISSAAEGLLEHTSTNMSITFNRVLGLKNSLRLILDCVWTWSWTLPVWIFPVYFY